MKFYFSGSVNEDTDRKMIEMGCCRLHSFEYKRAGFDWIKRCKEFAPGWKNDLMLDSGAFSGWSKGKPVSLEGLMRFYDTALEAVPDWPVTLISLDVIPGSRGTNPTAESIDAAVVQSQENYLILKDRYPNHIVMPVFHMGESFELLNFYRSHTKHLGFGMNQNYSLKARREWAMEWVGKIPDCKVHGLAATSNDMLEMVDWFSVDSATWAYAGAMGMIIVLRGSRRIAVTVSDESPLVKERDRHIKTMSEAAREQIRADLADIGYDLEEARVNYMVRHLINIHQFATQPRNKRVPAIQTLFP